MSNSKVRGSKLPEVIPGSRNDHVKHKGMLITVSDYKKFMKA
jgi:hypothetical protein